MFLKYMIAKYLPAIGLTSTAENITIPKSHLGLFSRRESKMEPYHKNLEIKKSLTLPSCF